MDAQELRNLQEAYMEVVENQQLDEANKAEKELGFTAKERTRARNLNSAFSTPRAYEKKYRKYLSDKPSGLGQQKHIQSFHRDFTSARRKEKANEQVDIYDIILSHLLDEGYAETPEAAEAIMVNMSEEWRDSIIG